MARFGAFEIDLRSGELRKQGLRLRLQEQPFQVLAALLERPGELVTREELVRRLWPDGTTVDFDRSLNAALTRLRNTLSDSADVPRYVETVARRGYRFIAPLEAPREEPVALAAIEEPPASIAAAPVGPPFRSPGTAASSLAKRSTGPNCTISKTTPTPRSLPAASMGAANARF